MTRPAAAVTLDDKYVQREGRVYLSGIQALVRLPLIQRERDAAAGLNTAGFISGYRGSPLGTFDQQLWKAKRVLDEHHVHFEPGLNEELAATAVWGSQQTGLFAGAKYDGVFSMWYGKAPGVDRAGDALRHGNAAGASRHGGVLVLMGDDHNCKSASLPSQSEYACVHAMIPVLNPANVADLLDFGLLGWALSRYSGAWVGLKCLIDTMDASASIDVSGQQAVPVLPADFAPAADGLNIRWPDPPLEQERRQHAQRMDAILAFARANRFDRVVIEPGARKRLGIVATGKSFLDVRQALQELGLSDATARDLGIGLYKVGMNWPLEPTGLAAFGAGYETLLVVEEKRDLIEQQVARILYGLPDGARPALLGKADEAGASLFPSAGELSATGIARVLGQRIARWGANPQLASRLAGLERREPARAATVLPKRLPYFCPGCPHNTSTKVPEGSHALAGIGCHYMVQWMDRNTETFTQMGGEGASWIGQAPFTSNRHVFTNLGDGTFAHSGSLAIRAAVAAKVNITYKLLYNDAVAMTGGQPAEGGLTVPQIAAMLKAEGVSTVRVVADEPRKYPAGALPPGVPVSGRDAFEAVQRELRELPGVTVLIYDQTCAAELRRRRKRKLIEPAPRRVFINEQVCEGCGDCGVQSNCVAIVPVETELGRKRAIDQSSCNQDLSCLRGFCPSFVTVVGAQPVKPAAIGNLAELPEAPLPATAPLAEPTGIVIGGIGGTGVVTIGALIGMAAHLERRGVSVLDMVGLSQKGGQVLTQLWLAPRPEDILATRIPDGRARLLLGCDLAVAASAEALTLLDPAAARAVINTHETMPAEFTREPDLQFPAQALATAIRERMGGTELDSVDATQLAVALLGDAVGANVLLLGYAWQKGLVPLSLESLMRAIELNDTAVAFNQAAFGWGRQAAHDPQRVAGIVAQASTPPRAPPADAAALVARRAGLLTQYQDARYARRYETLAQRVLAAEAAVAGGGEELARAVAENLYRLMAYKDEYEVARLYVETDFRQQLGRTFAGKFALRFHLAPPLFARHDPVSGRPIKREFGGWMFGVFQVLARLRRLRGTKLDVFGYLPERRMERRLIDEYVALVEEILGGLTRANHAVAVKLARLPEQMRGFGPVKQANVTRAKQQEGALLSAFRRTGDTALQSAA
jgi:indolepyruvate ferredoxin oxidoreductase